MNSKPNNQHELLIKDSYEAIPLNITHPIGHHKVSTFVKICTLSIKKTK